MYRESHIIKEIDNVIKNIFKVDSSYNHNKTLVRSVTYNRGQPKELAANSDIPSMKIHVRMNKGVDDSMFKANIRKNVILPVVQSIGEELLVISKFGRDAEVNTFDLNFKEVIDYMKGRISSVIDPESYITIANVPALRGIADVVLKSNPSINRSLIIIPTNGLVLNTFVTMANVGTDTVTFDIEYKVAISLRDTDTPLTLNIPFYPF